MVKIRLFEKQLEFDSKKELESYLHDLGLSLNKDGKIIKQSGVGVIPEILNNWFAQRKEFKGLMKKHLDEGNKELADFYDQRQHIQKIFLNSLYGVLGLPIFRFYDVDNALAVTATGQEVIKHSAEYVNKLYVERGVEDKSDTWLHKYWDILKEEAKKDKLPIPPFPKENDHCVYIDTDSLYFSSSPFLNKFETDDDKKQFTIKLAKAVEQRLNKYYDDMARDLFFCNSHKFFIKGESVAYRGLWLRKKRYVLDKIYDLETNKDVKKQVVKGLDVVRSSFPEAFRKFMKVLFVDILADAPQSKIDEDILTFRKNMETMSFKEIARNTSVKEISKFENTDQRGFSVFELKTPAHVKAAITYNRLLKHFKIENQYEKIEDGAKVKYGYLKENPLNIEVIALKGYNDPPQIIQFIDEYLDSKALFDKELKNKLQDIYDALMWGKIPTEVNQKSKKFFSF
jgi:DNA polymerase elongation subunit (family B)